jgi:hypothetical protein
MRRKYSLPFKTLLGAEVSLSAWHYSYDGIDWMVADQEEGVPGWDYQSPLQFRREGWIDTDLACAACDLPPGSELELTITASSPASRFRKVMFRRRLDPGRVELAPVLVFASEHLAETVRLETEVLLIRAAGVASDFSASLPASRLHTEVVTFSVEGNLSRMPVEVVPFASGLPWLRAPEAPWYVECGSGDLHAPVMRELRVFMNSDRQAYVERCQQGDAELVGLLAADVAIHVLTFALKDESFTSGSEAYDEGTLGEAAARLLNICFSQAEREEVARMSKENPGRFMAVIRSVMAGGHG